MEWYKNLASKWQRVLIALIFILLLVGIQLLRQMMKVEEAEPDKEKGTGTRFLLQPVLERVRRAQSERHEASQMTPIGGQESV